MQLPVSISRSLFSFGSLGQKLVQSLNRQANRAGELANFFCKGMGNKYLRLCMPKVAVPNTQFCSVVQKQLKTKCKQMNVAVFQ